MATKSYQIADSGARQEFDSGMVRDTREGKGRFDLLSPVTQRRKARHMEKGCLKYGDRNWQKGAPLSRFIDSAMRHLNDYLMIQQYKREGLDLATLPDDVNPNEDHLVAAGWNIDCALHHEELHPELNDLGPQVKELSAEESQRAVIEAYRLQTQSTPQIQATGVSILERLFGGERVKQ